MKLLKNILLYLSAFVPMYFLILVNLSIEILNKNLTFNVLNTTMFVMLSIFIALGIIGLLWCVKFDSEKTIKIKIVSKQNTTDQHFLGYFSLFVLFALSFELEKVSMACVFLLILVMVGIVYINSGLYYINPFLNMLGFNFYDITYVAENSNQKRNARIFYRGDLDLQNESYCVNLKNPNFSFVSKREK